MPSTSRLVVSPTFASILLVLTLFASIVSACGEAKSEPNRDTVSLGALSNTDHAQGHPGRHSGDHSV